MSFFDRLKASANKAEARLCSIIGEKADFGAENLNDSIAYSLLGGGKRLRAFLATEFCELCGESGDRATDYSAGIEMIHAFSLIHDDLPSMDNDDMRRGKPSNHKQFGEATAILAGDSLSLDAFYVIGGNKSCSAEQNLKATVLLAEKAGSKGMCAGQQCDLDGEGRQLSLDELTKLVDLKTGALFSCACMLGCIAANASEKQTKAAERFGLLCGRAFQITDDLLDIHSTSEELGKSIGKDISAQKSTFPSLLGESGAEAYAKECIDEAKECLKLFNGGDAKRSMLEFCDYVLARKS